MKPGIVGNETEPANAMAIHSINFRVKRLKSKFGRVQEYKEYNSGNNGVTGNSNLEF